MVFLFVLAFVIAAAAEFIRFRMELTREDHSALIDPHHGTVIMLPETAQAI